MIKLLRNKCNGRASSSPQKLKLFGDPIIGAMTLQMIEAEGEDLDDDLEENFRPISFFIFRFHVNFLSVCVYSDSRYP